VICTATQGDDDKYLVAFILTLVYAVVSSVVFFFVLQHKGSAGRGTQLSDAEIAAGLIAGRGSVIDASAYMDMPSAGCVIHLE